MNARNPNFNLKTYNPFAMLSVDAAEMQTNQPLATNTNNGFEENQEDQYIEDRERHIIFDLTIPDQDTVVYNPTRRKYELFIRKIAKNLSNIVPNDKTDLQQNYHLEKQIIDFLENKGFAFISIEQNSDNEIRYEVGFNGIALQEFVTDDIEGAFNRLQSNGVESQANQVKSELFDNFIRNNNKHIIFSEDSAVNGSEDILNLVGDKYLELVEEIHANLLPKIDYSKKEVLLANMVMRFFFDKGVDFAIHGNNGVKLNLDFNDVLTINEYIQSDILDCGKNKSDNKASDIFEEFKQKNYHSLEVLIPKNNLYNMVKTALNFDKLGY